MKILFKFKYPKLTLLIICIIVAYVLFTNSTILNFIQHLDNLNYLGIFIAGIMFAFGFLAPFSVGFFIVSNPSNIFIAGIIGGLGALVSDFFIFRFIRFSFMDEFKRLEKTKTFLKFHKLLNKKFSKIVKLYLSYLFAGILIASPLPDEIGVMMLAGLTKIKQSIFIVLSFVLNSLGIILIILI